MVKNPTCSTCNDGIIQVKIDSKKKKPYQFKLIGPGRENDTWSQADTYLGFVKTFRNLGVGKYILYIDSDDSLETTTCISTYEIELEDPCPVEINCTECEFGLNFKRLDTATTVNGTIFGQGVKVLNKNPNTGVSPFVHYQFGRKSYTVEFWFTPKNSNSFQAVMPLFYRSNHIGDRKHWKNIISGSSLLKKHLYHIFGLFRKSPTSNYQAFVDFGISINDASTYAATKAVNPVGFTATHEFLRIYFDNEVIFDKMSYFAFVIDYVDKIGPTYNFVPSDISVYVNGVLATKDKPNAVTNTLSVSSQGLLSNINNYIGPILIGTTDSDHSGFETNPSPPPPNVIFNNKYSTHGIMTNLRYYSRALSKLEIQNNYLSGCRGEPTSCEDLILWLPLNQTEGAVTLDKRYFNNGSLMYFKEIDYKRNGGAWVRECCNQITDLTFMDCPVEDCERNAVTFSIKILSTDVGAIKTYLILRLFDTNETPFFKVNVNDEVSDSDVYIDLPADANRTLSTFAEELANVIKNDSYWQNLDTETVAIEDVVKIKVPYNKAKDVNLLNWCGKGIFLALGRVNDDNKYVQIGNPFSNVSLKLETGKYTVCCPPEDCDLNENLEVKI
jgi:hypothetical protein